MRSSSAVVPVLALVLGSCTAATDATSATHATSASRTSRPSPDTQPGSTTAPRTTAPSASPAASPATRPTAAPTATPVPAVRWHAGNPFSDTLPSLPAPRKAKGVSLRMTGKWSVHLELAPPQHSVRCTSFPTAAGRQYVYEAYTTPDNPGIEYGVEEGQTYLQVQVGPDGSGRLSANMTVSWRQEGRVAAHQTSGVFILDRGEEMVFHAAKNRKSVQVAAVAVSETSDLEGIGWVRIVAALRCP